MRRPRLVAPFPVASVLAPRRRRPRHGAAGALVQVPSHPAFASLNIAGALTIPAYESRIGRHGNRLATSKGGTVVADLDIAAVPPPS